MGIQGTEDGKESSDVIILDDNFALLVRVVRWGCSVYANIQKFIQFQLTVNVAALIINFVSAISSGVVPLNTFQVTSSDGTPLLSKGLIPGRPELSGEWRDIQMDEIELARQFEGTALLD